MKESFETHFRYIRGSETLKNFDKAAHLKEAEVQSEYVKDYIRQLESELILRFKDIEKKYKS